MDVRLQDLDALWKSVGIVPQRAMLFSGTIRENLLRYEAAHCDVMNFNLQPADRKHEHVMESLELFAKHVMPEFKERHETTHKKWREQQLDGVDFPINSSI